MPGLKTFPSRRAHNKKVVGEVVTDEEIMADWEMEMRQIFLHGDYWSYATRVLRLLYEASEKQVFPTLTQLSEVIQYVNLSDLSRIITKPEERGYVKRTRTADGKVISANL